jgi:hypothetical protein
MFKLIDHSDVKIIINFIIMLKNMAIYSVVLYKDELDGPPDVKR